MCVVLASELRHDWLRRERDCLKLKLLLKSVWRGDAVWTLDVISDLDF